MKLAITKVSSLLVIGGTGFFGKSILKVFGQNGLEQWGINSVLIMARYAERLLKEAPELVSESVDLVSADITTINELPSADYVIHAAASTDARNYLNSPEAERLNILAATLNYSRLAKQLHRTSKIVYTSSGAVYGAQPESLTRIPEDSPLQPIDALVANKRDYAQAKRDSESIIRALGHAGLSVAIARCFAFVGPYLPRNQHFAIGNFIEDGLSERSIKVLARCPVYRSYMYSDDLVRWLMTMAEHSNPTAPTYNVGSDQDYTLRHVAEEVGALFGVGVDAQDEVESQIDRYVPCLEKAKTELGLTVGLGLSQAIAATVDAIKKHK